MNGQDFSIGTLGKVWVFPDIEGQRAVVIPGGVHLIEPATVEHCQADNLSPIIAWESVYEFRPDASAPTSTFQPAIVWTRPLEEVGEDSAPWGKLLGRVEIAGVPHHIEGWAVQDNEETGEQEAVDPWTSYEEVTNAMTEGAGVTVNINGHDYFMVVTPYQL